MAAGEWSAVEGKGRGRALVRKALAMLVVAGAALWVMALLHPTPVDATSHRAVRSFSASWVLPDGRLEVTITPTGYGIIGQVVETLPAGFSYSGSGLSGSQVAADGRTVRFTLLGEETFAYTVTAPAAARFLRISPGSSRTWTKRRHRSSALPAYEWAARQPRRQHQLPRLR